MAADQKTDQTFVGPHEGRELGLMLSGSKPLSMFVESLPAEFEIFPERDFDRLVSQGKLKKRTSMKSASSPTGQDVSVRRVFYALPDEEWRIQAMLLVLDLYDSLVPGWRPDLERVTGLLLGYDRADIEKFIELHK
jgi:hypothetical protein